MNAALEWWDGVEDWLTSLPFVPQLLVTLVILTPLAVLAAQLLNRLVRAVLGLFDRGEVSTEHQDADR